MMKRLKRIVVVGALFSILTVNNVYASIPAQWNELLENQSGSIILEENEKYSEDSFEEYARGTILSAGILRITNQEDGTLHISVDTAAHKQVDKIYQTVYLEMWDESIEDWVQIGNWDFERSKEEVNNDLTSYHVGFTVSGCEVNRYYRAQAIHMVELGDNLEGKATKTNGVLLTDHEV